MELFGTHYVRRFSINVFYFLLTPIEKFWETVFSGYCTESFQSVPETVPFILRPLTCIITLPLTLNKIIFI